MAVACNKWPEVTSPPARRVLLHLYRFSAAVMDENDPIKREIKLTRREQDYRKWVHERLIRSTLAQQLADGPHALPAIVEPGLQPLAAFLRLTRSRTLEAQVDRLVANLEKYLQPTQTTRHISKFRLALVSLCLIGNIALYFWKPELYGHIGLLLATTLILASQWLSPPEVTVARRRIIHASELFFFLRQAYADSDAGWPAHEAVMEAALQAEGEYKRTAPAAPSAVNKQQH